MKKLWFLGVALLFAACTKVGQVPPPQYVMQAQPLAMQVSGCAPSTDVPAVCGNGAVEIGEACDDGNTVSGDGCSNQCLGEAAADNIFNPQSPLYSNLQVQASPAANSDKNDHGKFRSNIDMNHLGYADPIVHPCDAGNSHLHQFYGNLLTNETTTTEMSLLTSPSSSALGGPLNKTAYWTPTLIRPLYVQNPDGSYAKDASGAFVRALDANGNPDFAVVFPDQAYVVDNHAVPVLNAQGRPTYTNRAAEFYYTRGVDPSVVIQPFPQGLRIVMGNHAATGPQSTDIVKWGCVSSTGAAVGPQQLNHVPVCAVGTYLKVNYMFPSCWDGKHLDVADHKSHMDYPTSFKLPNGTWSPYPKCQKTAYPITLPQVVYNIQYPVTQYSGGPSASTADWFLSSDDYLNGQLPSLTTPAGYSAHADWFMAWDRQIMLTFVQYCINGQRSCANGNLGNGYRLATQNPGAGDTAPYIKVVNLGAGNGVDTHP